MASVMKWIRDRPKRIKEKCMSGNVGCTLHHDRPLPDVPRKARTRQEIRNEESPMDPLFMTRRCGSPNHVYEEIPCHLVKDLSDSNASVAFESPVPVADIMGRTTKQGSCGPYLVSTVEPWKYYIEQNTITTERDQKLRQYPNEAVNRGVKQGQKHRAQVHVIDHQNSMTTIQDFPDLSRDCLNNVVHKHFDSGFGSLQTSYSDEGIHFPSENNELQRTESYQGFGSCTSKSSDSNYTYNEYDLQNSSSSTGSRDDSFGDGNHATNNKSNQARDIIHDYELAANCRSGHTAHKPRPNVQNQLDYYMKKVKQNLRFEEEVIKIVRESETSESETVIMESSKNRHNARKHGKHKSKCKGKTSAGREYSLTKFPRKRIRHSQKSDNDQIANGATSEQNTTAIKLRDLEPSVPETEFYRCTSENRLDIAAIEDSALLNDSMESASASVEELYELHNSAQSTANIHRLAESIKDEGYMEDLHLENERLFEKDDKDNRLEPGVTLAANKYRRSLCRQSDRNHASKEQNRHKRYSMPAMPMIHKDSSKNSEKNQPCMSDNRSSNSLNIVKTADRRKVSFDLSCCHSDKTNSEDGILKDKRENGDKAMSRLQPTEGLSNHLSGSGESSSGDKRCSPFQKIVKSSNVQSVNSVAQSSHCLRSSLDCKRTPELKSGDSIDRLSFRVSKLTLEQVREMRQSAIQNKNNVKTTNTDCRVEHTNNFHPVKRSTNGALNDLLKRNHDRQLLLLL